MKDGKIEYNGRLYDMELPYEDEKGARGLWDLSGAVADTICDQLDGDVYFNDDLTGAHMIIQEELYNFVKYNILDAANMINKDHPLNKFIDCDIIAVLYEIMWHHTEHYQSDFEIDKSIIAKAAESNSPDDNTLLWFSRPGGTHCLSERQAFIQDTYAHNTYTFYGKETSDDVIAYAIEINGMRDGKPYGDLYELDYRSHYKTLGEQALKPATVTVHFMDGSETTVPYTERWAHTIPNKTAEKVVFETNDTQLLESLQNEQANARHFGNYQENNLEYLQRYYEEMGRIGDSEERFLNNTLPAYGIYQLPFEHGKCFRGYEQYVENGDKPSHADYEFIYGKAPGATINLEELFDEYNNDHPQDYKGRSMSVSDVVVSKGAAGMRAYYVDTVGFQELQGFFDEPVVEKVKNGSGIEM